MATSAQIPYEAAEAQFAEGREPELVEGKVVERPMPNQEHAAILYAIITAIVLADKERIVLGRPELRVQTAAEQVRVAHLALYIREAPPDAVPTQPPATVIEILSPDDAMEAVMEKLCEYESWGVAGVWLVVPRRRAIYRLLDGALQLADEIEVGQIGIAISTGAVFEGQ